MATVLSSRVSAPAARQSKLVSRECPCQRNPRVAAPDAAATRAPSLDVCAAGTRTETAPTTTSTNTSTADTSLITIAGAHVGLSGTAMAWAGWAKPNGPPSSRPKKLNNFPVTVDGTYNRFADFGL